MVTRILPAVALVGTVGEILVAESTVNVAAAPLKVTEALACGWRIRGVGECYSIAVSQWSWPGGQGRWRRVVEGCVDEGQQSLERGEHGALARREMLDSTAESPASVSPAIAEVQDEGVLYGKGRTVLGAWPHERSLLPPLSARALSLAV